MKIKFAIAAVLAAVSFSAHADIPNPNDADYCYRIGRMGTDLVKMATDRGVSVEQLAANIMANGKAQKLDPQAIANVDMALTYLQDSWQPGETRKPAQICQEENDIMGSIQPFDPEAK